MKKLRMFKMLFAMVLAVIAISCKDDPAPVKPAVASFQYEVDEADFRKVTFTNFSQNFVSVSWDFGDGSAVSTETSPIHTFEAAGEYSVKLTVTGADKKTADKVQKVTISDPDIELKKITGETSKTWKLIRDVSTGYYPLAVGPQDHSQIWWASGLNEDLTVRPCLFNDEYVFTLAGKKYEYKTNGDIWEDGDVWSSAGCADTSNPDTFKNKDGADISAWGDGEHTFTYDAKNKKLAVIGTGAFIGLCKVVNDADGVKVPQASVTYNVIKLVDDVVDTLILEANFPNNGTAGYWRFSLVHYDDPSLEPVLGAKPTAAFSGAVADKQVTFTNSSTDGSYHWDFGDGSTSTDANPVHNYSTAGFYVVSLTVSKDGNDATKKAYYFISPSTITEAVLNGGASKTWKLAPVAGAFGVGPDKGTDAWWPNGGDISGDRPCLFNDEFIFQTSNVFKYDAKGDVFGEAYLGIADGCQDESTLSGNAAIFKSGTHSYSFTAASGSDNATITVSGLGAFIALPKAHNGGEYNADTLPTSDTPVTYEVINFADNGTKQAMQITVNIGGGFWSFVLVSQ